MNYEIESKLSQKVDRWELQNVKEENQQLKYQIQNMEGKISNLESSSHNRYYVLERLLNLFAEHPDFEEISHTFYELRNQL